MQDRYAGDIGDYVKLALLRAVARHRSLGVAWYLYPDEGHNDDGRHIAYLKWPDIWRRLDPELFDKLAMLVEGRRHVAALETLGVLPGARFVRELTVEADLLPSDRSSYRDAWFAHARAQLDDCEIVFADPDNGLIDEQPRRRRLRKFGKQIPLAEALALADGRPAIIYHHNTRFPGGHDLEVALWRSRLGAGTLAIRANAYSCRTFFIISPDPEIRERAAEFCHRWSAHRVWLDHDEVPGRTGPLGHR